jgi:hypothetical protein
MLILSQDFAPFVSLGIGIQKEVFPPNSSWKIILVNNNNEMSMMMT